MWIGSKCVCPKCQNIDVRDYGNFKTRPGYVNIYKKCMNKQCGCTFDGEFIKLNEDEEEKEEKSIPFK